MADLGSVSGLSPLRADQLQGNAIITYHGIDNSGNQRYNTRFISQNHLDRHLKALSKVADLVSIYDLLQAKTDPARLSVALTFDDGYHNNLSMALPVLEKYNAPACFCITGVAELAMPILWPDHLDIFTAERREPLTVAGEQFAPYRKYPWQRIQLVNQRGQPLKWLAKQRGLGFIEALSGALQEAFDLDALVPFTRYWQQLTQQEIGQVAAHPLITVASHGYRHLNLAESAPEEAQQDMLQSKQYLERCTDQPIDIFVYPDGSYNLDLVRYGLKQGYRHHLVVDYRDPDHAQQPAIHRRLTIHPYISTHNQIKAIARGYYYGT